MTRWRPAMHGNVHFARVRRGRRCGQHGPDIAETSQRNAVQVAKILDGAKPDDLPIERPSQFTFLINVKTVKALGLKVPDSLLLNAEQVGR